MRLLKVTTAREMMAACESALPADVAVCTAAVADWRPEIAANNKIKKEKDAATPTIRLVENPDILASLSAQPTHPFLVGFAAETQDVASYAKQKLSRKGLDMIAANQVGEGLGFEAADNALSVYWADGSIDLPRVAKAELARQLITQVAQRYRASRAG